ncbi:hypothetical protein HWI79_1613 [Cryptosporidium felis]|nr:hypothetical protein HWI79_1613 [Cryptosporidium felis]
MTMEISISAEGMRALLVVGDSEAEPVAFGLEHFNYELGLAGSWVRAKLERAFTAPGDSPEFGRRTPRLRVQTYLHGTGLEERVTSRFELREAVEQDHCSEREREGFES